MRDLSLVVAILIVGCAEVPTQQQPIAPVPTAERYSTQQCPALPPTKRSMPTYPLPALRARQSGWVMMEFDVTSQGQPRNIKVIEASPPNVFDASAAASLEQWIYALPTAREYRGCRQVLQFKLE